MIVTRAPLRLGLAGGGSDLPAWCAREIGVVVNVSLEWAVYATCHKHFDPDQLRVAYSQLEIVPSASDLKHDLIRETLKSQGVDRGWEITTVADVPGSGSGLGSSASTICAVLLGIHRAKFGRILPGMALADLAHLIEFEHAGMKCGSQDHYGSAVGGLREYVFSGSKVIPSPALADPRILSSLERHLLLVYLGRSRAASPILERTEEALLRPEIQAKMRSYVQKAKDFWDELTKGRHDSLGEILLCGQRVKDLVTGRDPQIQSLTARIRRMIPRQEIFGAKVSGAGGGGFLLVYARSERLLQIRETMPDLMCYPVKIDPRGARIVYDGL